MKQEQLIDDLIAQLEKIDKNEESLVKEVETLGCLDCEKQNLACKTPTLMEGLDRNEE